MKYSKVYLSILVLFLCLTVVSAVTYRQGIPIDIKHTVAIDGRAVTSASCNITAFDPDWNTLVYQGIMTPNSTALTYNYTLNESQTSKIGDYAYDIFCAGSGFNNTQHFVMPVTTTGKDYTTADSITNFFILIISIGIFVLFIWLTISIPVNYQVNEYNEILKVPMLMRQLRLLFGVLSYMTFVWLMFVFYNLTLGYSQLEAISNFFWFLHRFFISLLIPMIAVYFMIFAYTLVKDVRDITKVKRGLGLELK